VILQNTVSWSSRRSLLVLCLYRKYCKGMNRPALVQPIALSKWLSRAVFAFLIAIVFLGCGTYAVISGHPVAGSFFSLIGLGGIVTTFIIGRDAQKEVEVPKDEAKKPKQKPGNSKLVQPRAKR
jgi:hypothetical protein